VSEDTEFTHPWLVEYRGHSLTAIEIIHGALRNPELAQRTFFYLRDSSFISQMQVSKRTDFTAESPEAAHKLAALKEKIRALGRPVMENYPCTWDDAKGSLVDLDIFGQQVLKDLWNAICEEYPEGAPETDPLTIERQMHEAFAEERSYIHVGRIKQEDHLTEYVQGTDRRPVVITGPSGCGKSAFLASWYRKYASSHPDTFVLTYFIGASPSSTNYHLLIRNICEEIKRAFKLNEEIPEDDKKISETLAMFLVVVSKDKPRIVLVLDALDQLSPLESVSSLRWLLDYIPEKTRLVLSSLEGDFLDVLRSRQAEEITLPSLGKDEQRQVIKTVLEEWHRKLDKEQIEVLLSHSGVNNPLYLRVALEELRLFGSFDDLSLKINKLAEDIPGLFGQVLERLEKDHGKELVVEAFSLIGSSRYRLSEAELLEMLCRKGEEQFPRALWSRLARSFKTYMVYRGELIGFFHRQLADAVNIRYLNKDNKHKKLSAYFSNAPVERKLDEYPYQLHQAGKWKDLASVLSDLDFFGYAWKHNRKYEWMGYWRSLKGSFEPGSCYQSAIEAREKEEGETITLALLRLPLKLQVRLIY
jgi:nephrocystin-3